MRGLVWLGPEGQKHSTLKRRAMCALLFIIAGGTAVLWAQEPVALPASTTSTATSGASADAKVVRLLVGRSTVLDVGRDISRVSLTSAEIADALVTSPTQLLINGKLPGTISMFVWDRGNSLTRYEVVVQRDLARLSEQMRELFPGERIDVQSNGRNVVLSGMVTNKDIVEKAVSVAAGYVDKSDEVVSLLQLQPDAPSNQVLLRVRFAEVSRNGLTELGASFAANGYKNGRWYGRSTTQQFPAPQWDEDGKFVFSDFLNLFLFDTENQIAGVIKALQNKGLFQSLAEPNLVAESGKEASFLAGGEFPIPVVQGSNTNMGISVVFKEFGIRLNFTPTVNGDRVHLKVRPEVSTLDFNNAVTLNGFTIPALSTRRTETELELANGQTFAIAGLINNQMRSTFNRIPGIGHIPILGLLFSSKSAEKDQTELVVMITPQILPNNSRGVTPDLPRLQEPFLDPLPRERSHEPPPPAFGAIQPAGTPSAAPAASNGSAAPALTASPTATPDPASAAAAVSALTPAAPRVAEPVAAPVSLHETAPVTEPVVPVEPRPLTKEEQKALERALREEQKQAEQAAKEARKQEEKQRRAREKAEKEEQKRQEKLAREEAKRAAEEARRLGEAERRRQEAIAEAEAKLKEAEKAYRAELEHVSDR